MKSKLLYCFFFVILIAAKPLPDIELLKKRILNERVEILIPRGFEVMTEQQMDIVYARAQRRPNLIFTNNNSIRIVFSYSDNGADQDMVDFYLYSFRKSLQQQYKNAPWFGDGIKNINNRKVGYVEFMKPEMGHQVYTLVFFTDVEGKLLICTFDCSDRQKPEWQPIAKQIMLSLKAEG